jgi:hypothetical protein
MTAHQRILMLEFYGGGPPDTEYIILVLEPLITAMLVNKKIPFTGSLGLN